MSQQGENYIQESLEQRQEQRQSDTSSNYEPPVLNFFDHNIQEDKEIQIKKGKKILPIFQNIIWITDRENQNQNKILPVLILNFQIIYGNKFLHFDNKQKALDILKNTNNSQTYKFAQETQYPKLNAHLYLILCCGSILPYFQKQLAALPQVFKKCITFRNCTNNNPFVYGNIKQVYDIVDLMQKLIKYLVQLYQRNPIRMCQQFNISIKDQDQLEQCQENHIQRSNYRDQNNNSSDQKNNQQEQIIQKEIVQQSINQQNQKEQLIQNQMPQHQIKRQEQIPQQTPEIDEKIQKFFVTNALNKFRDSEIEFRFDPSSVSLAILTNSLQCREYQSGQILIRKIQQIKQLIFDQGQFKPKLIIISSEIHNQELQVVENQQVCAWIIFKIGSQALSNEQKQIYNKKYHTNQQITSNKMSITSAIDQLQQKINQVQGIIESQLLIQQ